MTDYHPLLKGAFELHCHSAPSIFPRRQSDWMLIDDIEQAGMAGVVIKAHEAPTADRASLIRQKYPHLHVYGGLACNWFTGGLNPAAVDVAIRSGAKVIWMPTISSKAHQDHFARKKTKLFSSERPLTHPATGIDIRNDQHRLKSEVFEILTLIAAADIILATGHLSPAEVSALVDAAIACRVQKILIQHPDMSIARIPVALQQELVRKGAMLEKCYLACGADFNDLDIAEMGHNIRMFGASSCVLVTDYGQPHNPPPVAGLSAFVGGLLAAGISDTEIEQMICANPRALLNI